MYAGMDFLRAAQIITDLPKPQYVKIIHNGNKRLRGTLVSFENNFVNVQTGRSLEKIDLDNDYPKYILENKKKFLKWTI